MEGGQQTVVVNKYERSPQARLQCIQQYGASCFVCNFDFAKFYGDGFMGYIHVHHIVPLSAKRAAYKQFVENESFNRFVGDMVYAITTQ